MSEDSRLKDARGPAVDSPQPTDSPFSSHSPHDPTVEMEGSISALADPSASAGSNSSDSSDDRDSPPAGPLLLEGEVLAGRYCVRRFLARGGGGEVYEAEDLELGGRVALKILASGPAGDGGGRSERFRREIQLARRVTHPNVCRLYEFGRHTAVASPTARRRASSCSSRWSCCAVRRWRSTCSTAAHWSPRGACRSSGRWRRRSTRRTKPAWSTATSRAPT